MSKRKERSIVCIVGRTNVGKSSLLNLLSGQKDFAIVDSAPGTTADTVTALMEIHDVGPCKVLDTAGVDEYSELGDKKRKKTFEAIEEADVSIIVIDLINAAKSKDVSVELELIERINTHKKQGLILYNVFQKEGCSAEELEKYRKLVDRKLGGKLPNLTLDATDRTLQSTLATFIKTFFKRENRSIDLLPNVKERRYVMLIIPMDEETPTLRLLRPQDMAVERLLRNFAIPVLYRVDLGKARSDDAVVVEAEKQLFLDIMEHHSESKEGLELVLTDSQAFDVVSRWVPKEIPLTSFSVMMTNYMSFGNLEIFTDGVKAVDTLKANDRILIVEACNHDRKCNDIGTVQIPKLLREKVGGELEFDFSFGKPFPDDLSQYKLIVHCGACMIDRQKYLRRVLKAQEAEVPMTNYGLLLSYLQGNHVLDRVVKPFLTSRKNITVAQVRLPARTRASNRTRATGKMTQ